MIKSKRPSYLSASNIYEVNIRQFTTEGTFKAFQKHLPRLKEMGVEILWLMPVYPIGQKNRKGVEGSYYSIKDFEDINPQFGTKQDFRRLVDAIHELNMKIILDWVANHAAWDNSWTYTHPDFFAKDAVGNFATPYDWTDVIQIDHTNEMEQKAMINAMEYWVKDFNIDGFRADLAHLTPLAFWKNARTKLDAVKQNLVWLAETENPEYQEVFDISYAWKWMHATENFVKNNTSINTLHSLLIDTLLEFPDSLSMYFTTNHDENSWNGTEFEKYGVYAKTLAVFSCTFVNSIPLIYSGQELPNSKRLHFFEKDEIDWKEKAGLADFYKTLLDLRKSNGVFRDNINVKFRFIHTDTSLLAFERMNNNDSLLVILNLNREIFSSDIFSETATGIYKEIFTKKEYKIDKSIPVNLSPGEFLVLEKNE
ncbi:MAG: alpha-amylase family glycosyl hydrolase [Ferruginibacter sp.]